MYDPTEKFVSSTISISDIKYNWNNTLVPASNPVLKKNAVINPFSLDIDWETTEKEMFQTMHDKAGIGLAAPQLGNDVNMFVMHHRYLGDIGVFNPVILEKSEEMSVEQEGCLSFPGLFFNVTRPEKIKVQYFKNDGQTQVETWMDGIDARCFQHEHDHLQGILHITLVSDFVLERAIKKRDKMIRKVERALKREQKLFKLK